MKPSMNIAACVTTRNRPEYLAECLSALTKSTHPPEQIIVSDDSSTAPMRARTSAIVERFSAARYLEGPRRGVCANRNHAVRALRADTDLVGFIDDDVCVYDDFFMNALDRYGRLGPAWRNVILSGVSVRDDGTMSTVVRLSFRGYFVPAETPGAVLISASVFPHRLLQSEHFDENIYFGYEDAELSLRALKRGYTIVHAPELRTRDTGAHKSSLIEADARGDQGVNRYAQLVEAARLYVGTKRYLVLFPNPVKVFCFHLVYFSHLAWYLTRRRSLGSLPAIVREAHLERLFKHRFGRT